MLVLVNGKRRHTTALVNINGTFGRGTVGTDMNSIPVAAIERIEVLRDGAAAQYGSDAIAGVINLVLKKKSPLTVSTTYGGSSSTTGEGAKKFSVLSMILPCRAFASWCEKRISFLYRKSLCSKASASTEKSSASR